MQQAHEDHEATQRTAVQPIPEKQLAPGQSLHGFTVLTCETLPEIDGNAYTLLHESSSAKLLYLQNNDANKAFSIAFKTPPADDTGVFHILEHSVLCGSTKFPVKEPFVNLLKSSMQTFLNAMTFPDKTMYPVASTNEQDLLNLMDVYLDAVLHPMIFRKRAIFEQEGWHYELAGDAEENAGNAEVLGEAIANSEAADAHAHLVLNGVVYNEMKGALSDPNSVLYDELQAALFPDTTYRFESGGTPRAIPDLTYEQFLEEHRRHYRLDNSFLTLYGNLNIDVMLAFLDKEYLSPVAQEQSEAAFMDAEGVPLSPHPLDLQAPITTLGVVRNMSTAPENSCSGLGYVVGTAHDRTRVLATDILIDAIMGSNEAPLKRALLDANLADDAQAFLADSVLQPFVVLQLRGLRDGAGARFRTVVEDALVQLTEGGLDHTLVEASLSHTEFTMRERDFGVADGVALSVSALSGWLYGDDLATAYLRYEADFAFLRNAMEDGYFEQLIREVFLENNHKAEVEIQPVSGEEDAFEEERLTAVVATMDAEDFSRVADEEAELRRLQEEPDSPEALATLPRLSKADLGVAPQESPYGLVDNTPVPCLHHHIPTRGIAYAYRYFSLNQLTFEELPYATVLATVLGKLSTDNHTAAEIDTLTQSRLGSLTFFAEVHENQHDQHDIRPMFVTSASALSENVDDLAALPNEIMLASHFHDSSKIKDALTQKRVAMEQGFASAGHTAALSRSASYFLPAAVVGEQLSGVDFYRFLKDLLDNFDERVEELTVKLSDVAQRIFSDAGLVISFTGSDDDFTRFWAKGGALGRGKTTNDVNDVKANEPSTRLIVPKPEIKNEAFIVPTDVVYCAMGYDRKLLGLPYSGMWLVASRALSYDYLWSEVRVKGGAYGAGFSTTRSGTMRFYSYRDPHLDETFARFCSAGAWLSAFDPSVDQMDGYVVSTVAALDAPLKPRELARRQDGRFFAHVDDEVHLITRAETIATDAQSVRMLGTAVTEAAAQNMTCVFGNKDIIAAANTKLSVIDLLNEQ